MSSNKNYEIRGVHIEHVENLYINSKVKEEYGDVKEHIDDTILILKGLYNMYDDDIRKHVVKCIYELKELHKALIDRQDIEEQNDD